MIQEVITIIGISALFALWLWVKEQENKND